MKDFVKSYKGLAAFLLSGVLLMLVGCYQEVDVTTLSVKEEVDASYTTASISVKSNIVSKNLLFRVYIATDSSMNTIISKVELGDAGGGSASAEITNLDDGKQYFYQVECYSAASKKKCDVNSFTTLTALRPTVQTIQSSNITSSSAVSGGRVTSDGGVPVTVRGVCWSTSQNPTTSNDKTTNGSGTGSYNSNIQGLTRNTTYYVRAYATNKKGTSYGDQYSFTTSADLPMVTTTSISSVTGTSAVGGGSISSDGGATVTARGICWSTTPSPTVVDNHTTNGSGTGVFTGNMTGLAPNTIYYVRAYATNSIGTSYGGVVSFTTNAVAPTVTTSPVSSITALSASCGGNVTATGGASVTARGVCWSTSQNPTISNSHSTNGTGSGSFTSSLTGLTAGTTYYVRAYATNSAGTSYGAQISFTTGATTPTVTTSTVSSITTTSASCGGTVTATGGASVTARGVCWSTSQNPIVSNSHTTNGTGSGSFTSSITGLTAGTTYYIRAYATNSAGTSYGTQVTFSTSATTPTVSTSSVSNITGSTASCGGNVTSTGGASVTARGVCWSTSQNPTISNSHTTNGSGTGSFTSSITGLTAGTTYYVRAYATNSAGTSYGIQVTFSTSATTPTVSTASVSNITGSTASCGGNVTSTGGASVTARGVCWSTSQNPTISNSHTTNGTGTGSFTSSITGLTAGTTYYVRAYATNSSGTSYGTQVTFSTTATTPTVSTSSVSNITGSTASCGGTVTATGGASVTARGVCWSTSQNPTISNSHTTNGTGSGSFTSSITGLTAGTIYYVRAYATNSVGTSYGPQETFTTATLPTVTTASVTSITSTSASCGGNVTATGGASVTARGVCWSTSQNPTISSSHTTNGTGSGSFISILTGLTAGTTYYVRAYATNSEGTSYGTQRNFTTSTSTPTVTTNTVTNVTSTTATCGGNVTSTGGSAVTNKGVCWSTSPYPTINNDHTIDGSGTGTFTSNLTGLTQGTTYYIRAYAMNSRGVSYGIERSFTTPTNQPLIVSAISLDYYDIAYVDGVGTVTIDVSASVSNVSASGVTSKGFCWSTGRSTPTWTMNTIQCGSGYGSMSSGYITIRCPQVSIRAWAKTGSTVVYGPVRYIE